MNILKEKNFSIVLIIVCLIAIVITIVIVIKVFNSEKISFKSFQIDIAHSIVTRLTRENEQLENDIQNLSGYLFTVIEIKGFTSFVPVEAFSEEERLESGIWIVEPVPLGDNYNTIINRMNSYNTKYKQDQYYNPSFYKELVEGKEIIEYDSSKDFDNPESTLDSLLLNLKNRNPLKFQEVAEDFNSFIEKKILVTQNKIKSNLDIISIKNSEIIAEERRLERVSIRNTNILFSKGITVVFAIVILLTLLSLFRYSLNLYNKYQMQLLIIEKYEKNTDIELLKLLLLTNFQYDNKAEEFLNNLFKNK